MRDWTGKFWIDRAMLDHYVLKGNTNRIALWTTIIGMACWKNQDSKVMIGNEVIQLQRGQLITGSSELSTVSGVSMAGIDKILLVFEKHGFCRIKRTSKGSMITELNYDKYQSKEEPSRNEVGTKEEPSRNEVGHTNKENKENKENKVNTTTAVAVNQKDLEPSEQLGKSEEKTEEKKNKHQRDKEHLMTTEIESPEDLISYWFDILNVFGVEKPLELDENSSRRDFACCRDMLDNKLTDINGLKLALYEYAFNKCINPRSKSVYEKKAFSSTSLGLYCVCRIMQKNKIVGYAVKKENKVNAIELRDNKMYYNELKQKQNKRRLNGEITNEQCCIEYARIDELEKQNKREE